MPMHDWTKVEAGIYHAFHGPWLQAIARALNNGLLPAAYYAMTEQVTMSVEADVLTLQIPHANGTPAGSGVLSLTTTRPAVGVLVREQQAAPKRRGRVLVRHVSTHKVVAVIELVSPGNKSAKREYAAFVMKAADVLAARVHLLVIDPFPPPAHTPGGLHASIWPRVVRRRKGRQPFTLSADRPLVVASYAAGQEVVAAVQPFAVGEPVPEIPLFLTVEQEYVTLPLEPTYATAWPDVPKVWRDVIEA